MTAFQKNTLTIIASTIVAFVVVEVILRVFELAPTAGISSVNERQFFSVPGVFAPGQSIIDRRIPELAHRISINSLGYRGSELSVGKEPQEFRIFVAGDSFTYGDFVDDEQTIPALMETELGVPCRGVSVINGGLGGSTIRDQIHMIKRAEQLDPNLIVLIFYENDIRDLAGQSMWETLALNRKRKSELPLSIIYPILKDLAIWNLALKSVREWRSNTDSNQESADEGPSQHSDRDEDLRQRLRQQYMTHLASLLEYLRERNLPLLIMAYPSHLTYSTPDTDANIEWIMSAAEELGVPAVNLLVSLRASSYKVNELYLLPLDGHASPMGNRVAALEASDAVLDIGVIPEDYCTMAK